MRTRPRLWSAALVAAAAIVGGIAGGVAGLLLGGESDHGPESVVHRSVAHAWLGVAVETIGPASPNRVEGLPGTGAIVVHVTAGSPAARAGLVPATRRATVGGVTTPVGGDVVVEVDGRPVTSAAQVAGVVAAHGPGDTVSLGVVRDGAKRTVAVTLGTAPANGMGVA